MAFAVLIFSEGIFVGSSLLLLSNNLNDFVNSSSKVDKAMSSNVVDIKDTKKLVSEMAKSAPIDVDKVAKIKAGFASHIAELGPDTALITVVSPTRQAHPFQILEDGELTEVTKLQVDDDSGFTNREIYSLNQFGGEKFSVEGTDVFLYEQKAGLLETGDGLIISTDRVIGADAAETNLVRAGDTLNASTSWINTGNTDLVISDVAGLTSDANAVLRSYGLSQETLLGGTYGEDGFISSTEELTLTADITITGDAGSVVDLSKSILEVSASGIDETFSNGIGSKNLITYQGDLNYDGRVSMKDLAYLNAGAARVNSGGDVAGDVDANYDESIDLLDLAVLDKDWGKSLHNGADNFLGSNDLSWEDLDKQGSKEWDNAVFKEQNAFEAFEGFVGSLESPTSSVIGADGNTNPNDDDLLGTNFQEII